MVWYAHTTMERVGSHQHYCSDCDALYVCALQEFPCHLENAVLCLYHYKERFGTGDMF